MLKRGQVTIFLVVGIVILLLAGLFFYLFGRLTEAPLEVEEEGISLSRGVKPALQGFVEKCIKDTVDPAVYLLAIQGGIIYLEPDSSILLTNYGFVNYAWLNGAKGISKEKMEKDLAKYLENYVDLCLGNFDAFTKEKITVAPNYNQMSAKVIIRSSSIEAQVKLPMVVTLPNNDTFNADSFTTRISSYNF